MIEDKAIRLRTTYECKKIRDREEIVEIVWRLD